jgi:hypothetical protein
MSTARHRRRLAHTLAAIAIEDYLANGRARLPGLSEADAGAVEMQLAEMQERHWSLGDDISGLGRDRVSVGETP